MIREKFRKWLGIDRMEKQNTELLRLATEARTDIDNFKKLVDIGVDYHEKYDYSWAVICVRGKTEYVRFAMLDNRSVMQIGEFIKRLTYNPKTAAIDSPRGMPKELFIEL